MLVAGRVGRRPAGTRLSDFACPYIWLDATYIKCRNGARVQATALVTVIGVSSGGYVRLLGLDVIDAEPYDG